MKIQSKQDVINWLIRLKEDHPLSVGKARLQGDGYGGSAIKNEPVLVYTDQIIRDRYTGMIEYLESEEVA